jgi:hypothetical protein
LRVTVSMVVGAFAVIGVAYDPGLKPRAQPTKPIRG